MIPEEHQIPAERPAPAAELVPPEGDGTGGFGKRRDLKEDKK